MKMEAKRNKKAQVAKVIPDKIDFKTKSVRRDKGQPCNSTSVYICKETQESKSKRHIQPHDMFIAVLFTVAKIWKQSKCPTTDE